MTDEQIAARRAGYNPWDVYHRDAPLRRVLDMIGGGFFSADQPDRFKPLVDALTHDGDRYFLLADYRSYIDCQDRVDALFRTPEEWIRRAILNVAGMGRFSSDRTTQEYAERVWGVNAEPNEENEAG
jgi:starch phosphorylase